MSDKRPEDVIRDGNIKASIWRNEGEKGPYYTTTLARTYRDENDNLRDSNAFSSADLLRVSEISRQAYTRSNELRREDAKERYAEERQQFKQERQAGRSQEKNQDRGR